MLNHDVASWTILSKHRSALMGLSMLTIMIFHCQMDHSDGKMWFLISNGSMGVEFFLLLSAIGLTFSLSKNSSLSYFYKRRLVRIVPTYFIAAFPYFVITYFNQGHSIPYILARLSMVTIFVGDGPYWFIPMILICYIIAPALYKFVNQKGRSYWIPVVSHIFFIQMSMYYPPMRILFLRFSCFLLGMIIAQKVLGNASVDRCVMLFSAVIGVFVLMGWGMYGVSIVGQEYVVLIRSMMYLTFGVPLLISLAYVLDVLPLSIVKIMAWIGTISLELYMVHERLCISTCRRLFDNDYIGNVVSILMAIVLAWLLHQMMSFMLNHCRR